MKNNDNKDKPLDSELAIIADLKRFLPSDPSRGLESRIFKKNANGWRVELARLAALLLLFLGLAFAASPGHSTAPNSVGVGRALIIKTSPPYKAPAALEE